MYGYQPYPYHYCLALIDYSDQGAILCMARTQQRILANQYGVYMGKYRIVTAWWQSCSQKHLSESAPYAVLFLCVPSLVEDPVERS